MIETPVYTIKGEQTTLQSVAGGKPMYVKFWASWCRPCLAQMEHFEEAEQQFGDRIAVIAVNIDINDSAEEIENVRQKFNLSMPIVLDRSGELAAATDLRGTPYHLLLNRQGDRVFSGHDTNAQLDQALLALGEEPLAQPEQHLPLEAEANTAVLYTSTWCDWYLKDSRPALSNNCIQANTLLDQLATRFPQLDWRIVVSRMWTGEKEKQAYQKKYALKTPVEIDMSNQTFLHLGIKDYPTLVVRNQKNKELRIDQFDNLSRVEKQISHWL